MKVLAQRASVGDALEEKGFNFDVQTQTAGLPIKIYIIAYF